MSCCSAQGIYNPGDTVTWNDGAKQKRGKIVSQYGDYQWCVRPDGSQTTVVKSQGELQLGSGYRPSRPQIPRRPSGDGRRPGGRKPKPDRRRRSDSDSSRGSSSESMSGMRKRKKHRRGSVSSNASSASAKSRDFSDGEVSETEDLQESYEERAGPVTEGGDDPGFFGALTNNFSINRLGTTGFAGLAAGYFTGKLVNYAFFYVGLVIVVFQLMVFKGWLGKNIQDMVYGNAKKAALAALDADGDGNIELSDLMSKLGQLKTILATGLTDAIGFGSGFMLGVYTSVDLLG